jgi:predicted membrane-bound spermidine synthase
MKKNSFHHQRNLLYLLFTVSGFSGLIYESIWSHYLKLFLGHAAYAQTLVLAIFMGGMAIGSWLAGRYSVRWRNLLLGYALIEGVIGLCALVFHGVFVSATDLAYSAIIPKIGSPWAVDLFKWSLAGSLILPQSVLLGATFPLMSAGLIRRFPAESGTSLSMLYFTNSLGAAVGVLVSGFVLMNAVGLPGTILTAGLINISLALVVWSLVRNTSEKPGRATPQKTANGDVHSWRLLLAASLFTGAASFMYEIGWIRMLSLVLGSSTHSFELMLSAFIFGLAFGGLWMRQRINHLKDPMRFLGVVQIVMGLFALATLVTYNASFDLMHAIMKSLARTSDGYGLFNIASHAIALGIMLPATFCAGMTLPLITHMLLRRGHGENSIGAVYAANTVGAIAGVFFAVHVGLPVTGVKGLVTIGAAVDMALGVVLIRVALAGSRPWTARAAAVLASVAVIAVLSSVELDQYKMASGVYRVGTLYRPGSVEILYHKDGKTATVDLLKHSDGRISIRTNGKVDAALNMSASGGASTDESAMIMTAAVPLALYPQARTVANIGLGSGLTTHVLLSVPNVERVDTIEIEPAIVEAARGFGSRVERAFDDPRSVIHIDDAKSFFAAYHAKYDIIVSEPSNPWVSGVSGLFSDEFYRRVRGYLNARGLFVQWIQLYEIDIGLVSSVMKAIDRNFDDYAIYAADDANLLIVAQADGPLPPLDPKTLAQPGLATELRRIDIQTPQDFAMRHIGDRKLLAPLFASSPMPVNSDFFPVLDLNAARTRFMNSGAPELVLLGIESVPVLEMLDIGTPAVGVTEVTASRASLRSQFARTAVAIRDFYDFGALPAYADNSDLAQTILRHALVTQRLGRDCRDARAPALWLDSVFQVAKITLPQLRPQEAGLLSRRWWSSDCYARLSQTQINWLELFKAVGSRDAPNMVVMAERLIASLSDIDREKANYVLNAGMLGYLAQGQQQNAQRLWLAVAPHVLGQNPPDLAQQLLWVHSVRRNEK